MSRITVSGANLPPSDPPGAKPITPARLNIANLIKNEKQWALYVQALTLFQHIDPAKPLSWFALSAIHGYPIDTQWEKAGAKSGFGYCVHGLPHFPTWHRPYLAVYEQALQAAALEVAQKYKTDTADWVRAALELRSPYWDWADPTTYLPPPHVYDSVKFKNLSITTPDGQKDVPNPLLAYAFQRKIKWHFRDPTTLRHPRPTAAASIKAFEDDVKSNAVNGNLQLACWKTLNWTRTWLEFSNQGATRGQRANSVETLHNWIHTRTGGGGHMSDPIASAFDPIFMLHHTNVDRQLALWQALHPDIWISGTTANRDLVPFWKSGNAFHRSTDDPVRTSIKFGSTYPEFVGLESLSPAQRQAGIQAKVDALYDSNNGRRGIAVPADVSSATVLLAEVAETRQAPLAFAAAAAPPAVTASAPDTHGAAHHHATTASALTALQRLDWFIRVRVKKFQLKQSFSILFFLGPVPDDVAQWRSSPNLVGNHSEFVNSDPGSCANCQENVDAITEGFIDLDTSLERKGFGPKSEREIERFIHDEIHWRIQQIDGTIVPASEVEVLEVSVMTWDVTDGDLEVRPVHRDLTSHKDGGRVPGRKPYELGHVL